MEMPAERTEPAKRPQPSPAQGAPETYAAYASRKDVAVRVSVRPLPAGDAEELREDGYGHGV